QGQPAVAVPGVPTGAQPRRCQARRYRARARARAASRGDAWRAHLGRQRAREGLHIRVHTGGTAMANELILIVEDDDNRRKALRDALQVKGYETMEAATGELGLKLASERPPALILMDIQLPGMTGFAALQSLRGDPSTRSIPVIAVTASVMSAQQNDVL